MLIDGIDSDGRSLPVKVDSNGNILSNITNGTNNIDIDGDGAVTVKDKLCWLTVNGKQFMGSVRNTSVADNNSVEMLVVTGADSAHGMFTVEADGKCYVDLYESTTYSGSPSPIGEFIMDRSDISSGTNVDLHYNPTITNNGTILEVGILGSAGKFTTSGGETNGGFWLLKPYTNYMCMVTNKSGGAADIVIKYVWHEH